MSVWERKGLFVCCGSPTFPPCLPVMAALLMFDGQLARRLSTVLLLPLFLKSADAKLDH